MNQEPISDEERICQLGFVMHPRSPITLIQPAQSRQWLSEKQATRARLSRPDKLAYLDAVAKEHETHDAKLFDLEIINRCLREHIESSFSQKFNRCPNCSLDVFLYSPVIIPSKLPMPEKRQKKETGPFFKMNAIQRQSSMKPYSLDMYP